MKYDRSYLNIKDVAGIRNNNPGNIEKTQIAWLGKIAPGGHQRFEQFQSIALGIRAMLVDLRNKISNKGLDTIEKILYVWAPPSENNTEAYINAVAASSGIPRKTVLDPNSSYQMQAVARAMAKHETGKDLDPRFFQTAWSILDGGAALQHISDIKSFGGSEFKTESQNKQSSMLLPLVIAAAATVFLLSTKKRKK